MGSKAQSSRRTFQNPRGTRDFYPLDLLKRRYITETWRAVSIRHGFEEIDGPTFEHAELYTVKSGEGILSELFSFSREGGDDLYALRPEFTPTLARMYAAQAASLPKPCRWFCIPNFFRAERPQRGRLREFCQWNCDVMGLGKETEALLERDEAVRPYPEVAEDVGKASADGDTIAVLMESVAAFGLTPNAAKCRIGDRQLFNLALQVSKQEHFWDDQRVYDLFDKRDRLPPDKLREATELLELDLPSLEHARLSVEQELDTMLRFGGYGDRLTELAYGKDLHETSYEEQRALGVNEAFRLSLAMRKRDIQSWVTADLSIVRGLAYYTGTVFEVLAEGERAIAGGGRYDNLIELFGGPSTPACGFGMGDVVLGNLLADHGLMPGAEGDAGALMDAVQNVTTGALGSVSLRPDVFVVSADERVDAMVIPLVAQLRRGVESDVWRERGGKPWEADRYAIPPLHARPTDKSTRHLSKLLKDAERMRARYCAIVHEGGRVQLKDLDKHEDLAHPSKGDWSANPADEHYIGQLFAKRG